MHVPQWLAFTIAAAVILFGCFRIYIAVAGKPNEERAQYRRGLYAMPRWQHGLVGVLFLLVGGALTATALGWNPVATAKPPADDGNEIKMQRIDLPRPGGGSAVPITPR